MLRRLLPTLVALGCGLLALGWGLFALQRIFSQERDDALAQVHSRRQALEHFAAGALRQVLVKRLEESIPALYAAMENPLAPGEGFYIVFRGRQLLPRVLARSGSDTPARDTYQALAAPAYSGPHAHQWEPRMARLHAAEEALLAGNGSLAASRLEALLRYHSDHPLPPDQELPFLLLAVERLQRGPATAPLVRALVREGLPEEFGGIARAAGLQRDLLRARETFTEADFDFLHQRIARLSDALGEPTADFRARAAEADARRLAPLIPKLEEPILVDSRWYLEPRVEGVHGLALDMAELLRVIADDMRARRLFDEAGQIELRSAGGRVQLLRDLRVSLELPEWTRAAADIEARYWLKTLLVTMCGGLALAIFALAVLAQQRKYRFLELKSDFVATVSHELRTPLASIRLMGETLERKLAQVPEVRDYPARIVQASDGLHFLVENILSFNRIDKGRWQLRTSRVRLEELINPLRDDLASATSEPVHLTADVGEAELEGDPSLLRMVFSNLGRNACNYNRRSPVELSITAQVIPGMGCTVLFSDNGVGIPPAEWDNVFLDFYRVVVPGREEIHGSGLGLALCLKIMKMHKGDIQVASSSPEGTTFVLTFPEPLSR